MLTDMVDFITFFSFENLQNCHKKNYWILIVFKLLIFLLTPYMQLSHQTNHSLKPELVRRSCTCPIRQNISVRKIYKNTKKEKFDTLSI